MVRDVKRILIAGDWDADGVIATALVYYAQAKLGKYPYEAKAVVDMKPLDPERFSKILTVLEGSYDAIVMLDIPFFNRLPNMLKLLKEHMGVGEIMFVDHHLSSHLNRKYLEPYVDKLILDDKPTAAIIKEQLVARGIRIPSRLEAFVEVVTYMDSGKRVPQKYMKLFELVSKVSKALTVMRDEEIWEKFVLWLASPFPTPLDPNIFEKVEEAVKKRDEELKNLALDLAMGARRIGDLRFIDARKKWKTRGGTALVSKISHVLRAPVAVLFDTRRNFMLLIIKAPGGKAYRIAKNLVGEGIAENDIAGHPNLAIVRIRKDVSVEEIVRALHKALYYAA